MQLLISALKRFDEATHAAIPSHQLLDFHLGKDGYPELCAFLGVASAECPTGKFPHINVNGDLRFIALALLSVQYTMVAVMVTTVLLAVYGVSKCCKRRSRNNSVEVTVKKTK